MSMLYASAARRCITPSEELIDAFNQSAKKPHTAPISDIFVQALVFSDGAGQALVHVGGDLIMTFGERLTQKICERFSVDPKCVFYSCTHNHMVPDMTTSKLPGMPPKEPGPGLQAWTDFVHDQAFAAVTEAFATLRPARIGVGHGVSGLSVNRDWNTPVGPLGTGDRNASTRRSISVLRVDTIEGDAIALLTNGNCHAGSFFGGIVGLPIRLTGGDVAGYIEQALTNAIEGCVPIWAIGGAGDQNTYLHSGMMWPQVDDSGRFYQETYIMDKPDAIALARQLAMVQALEILDIYNGITHFSTEFSLKSEVVYRTVRRVKQLPPGSPPQAPGLPVEYEDTVMRFYLIVLGNVAFAGANAESFVGLAQAVRQILPYEDLFFIDMNCDEKAAMAGYTPAPRYDMNYAGGKRHSLRGTLLPYEGVEMLHAYCDGFAELLSLVWGNGN